MPILSFNAYPHYTKGIWFYWELDSNHPVAPPYAFVVEVDDDDDGSFRALSPDITDTQIWVYDTEAYYGHYLRSGFRLRMADSTGQVYYSDTISLAGDLHRDEYLYMRSIMRDEYIQMKGMGGVQIHIWRRNLLGVPCTECRDPVTGGVSASCDVCYGTGINPPYAGPYTTWMEPSVRSHKPARGQPAPHDPQKYEVRILPCPPVSIDDILIDTVRDERYHVKRVASILEIRRLPVVQQAAVALLDRSDPAYGIPLMEYATDGN